MFLPFFFNEQKLQFKKGVKECQSFLSSVTGLSVYSYIPYSFIRQYESMAWPSVLKYEPQLALTWYVQLYLVLPTVVRLLKSSEG